MLMLLFVQTYLTIRNEILQFYFLHTSFVFKFQIPATDRKKSEQQAVLRSPALPAVVNLYA